MLTPEIILKSSKEKKIHRRHPWIFSGSIQRVEGNPISGESVIVKDSEGNFIGWGAYSPSSKIRVRLWSWEKNEVIDTSFFHTRLQHAIHLRQEWFNEATTNAYRLVNAESDGIPGLVIDKYADILVFQFLSAGVELQREVIISSAKKSTGLSNFYERSDADVRLLEGLENRSGYLSGSSFSTKVSILENGLRFWVDIENGHKTGFYLDQRDNRLLCKYLSKGKRVLNCFSYTGGFSIFALSGGAESCLSIDSSSDALDLGKRNLEINNLSGDNSTWIVGDVFFELRKLRDRNAKFDLIILDPPKFAPIASQVEQAVRGYKDINLIGLKLLNPGGYLMTFSCSGAISRELFQKIVAGAAVDAKINAKIVRRFSQALDHPVGIHFPEGEYLKGLLVRV